jgi:hypothetical protein
VKPIQLCIRTLLSDTEWAQQMKQDSSFLPDKVSQRYRLQDSNT